MYLSCALTGCSLKLELYVLCVAIASLKAYAELFSSSFLSCLEEDRLSAQAFSTEELTFAILLSSPFLASEFAKPL